ncbi:MAG: hypothetical protein ABIL05_05230, partial [candidate division WOR-3 bacterium]
GKGWYESHGFSRDDKKIYFSGNLLDWWSNNIYCCGLNGADLTPLTHDDNIWNEMAELSPDNRWIAFISSRPFKWKKRLGFLTLKTEVFLMDTTGQNIQQITYLNDDKHSYLIGDLAWSPDGKTILAVAYERKSKKMVTLKIEFEEEKR